MKKTAIPKEAMRKYLSAREGRAVKILEYVRLGSGWHGTGYRITYKAGSATKRTILRTLSPVSFSHDYPSDRAATFILQNKLFNSIPGHIPSVDVGGLTKKGGLISLGDADEFFQIVEVASGRPYMEDIERIAKDGRLHRSDVERAVALSDYLASLHAKAFKGPKEVERSVRLRHLRDAVGHGEMLLGVIDTYPDEVTFVPDGFISDILCKAVRFNRKISKVPFRLTRVHGDFHPGNIWFGEKGDFTLLDASRQSFGVSSDDITALSINYIWYALRGTGSFSGPFKDLFLAFWNNYIERSKDDLAGLAAPLFFAFRASVVSHPLFYPEQRDEVRRKLFNFISNVLDEERFDPSRVNDYIKD